MSTAITTNKGGGASLKNLSKYQNIFNTYTLEKVSFYKMVPGMTDGVHRIQEKTMRSCRHTIANMHRLWAQASVTAEAGEDGRHAPGILALGSLATSRL